MSISDDDEIVGQKQTTIHSNSNSNGNTQLLLMQIGN